jgi:hypothetical protein
MQARNAALDRVAAIAARNAVGCSDDTHCVLVDLTLPCQENCPAAIDAAHRSGFEQELAIFAAATCPTLPATCAISPNCAALAGARCTGGTCRPVVAP